MSNDNETNSDSDSYQFSSESEQSSSSPTPDPSSQEEDSFEEQSSDDSEQEYEPRREGCLRSPFSSDFIKNRHAEKRLTPIFERKTPYVGKRSKLSSAATTFGSLSQHCQELLHSEEVDDSLLMEISQSQMKDLGLKIGDQLKILRFQKNSRSQVESFTQREGCQAPRTSGRVDPNNLPKWNPKKSDLTPKEYLRRLRLAFISMNYDPSKWHIGLELAMEGSAAKWASRSLSTPGMTWEKAQRLFRKYYARKDQSITDLDELTGCCQKKDEDVAEYNERFLDVAQRCGVRMSSSMGIRLYVRGLLPELEALYATATVSRKNRPKTILEAIRMAKHLERKPKDRNQFRPATESASHNKPAAKEGLDYPKGGCWKHPKIKPGDSGFHSTHECKRLRKQATQEETQRITPANIRNTHSGLATQTNQFPKQTQEIICYGCGKVGHKRTECPNKSRNLDNKRMQLEYPTLEAMDKEIQSLETYLELPTLLLEDADENPMIAELKSMSTRSASADSVMYGERYKITFPLDIEKETVTAFYDTGCVESFMDESYAMKRGFYINPTTGHIQLGDTETKIPRRGSTSELAVSTRTRMVKASFEIVHLDYPIYVGVKLGIALGIGQTGLPMQSTHFRAPLAPQEDQQPKLIDIMEDGCTLPHEDQVRIKTAIEPLLQTNQSVSGFCPHPEAEVALNLTDTTPIYIKQYRIAQRFHEAVTATVKGWAEKGVIREVEFSRFNNPLTVSIKKDPSTGRKSLDPSHIRVNFDGRTLNSRMSDYIYELPIISELFESLSGANVYSSIDIKDAFCTFPIREKDQKYLAFTWDGRHYVWVGAPFGLKILSFQFQRIMRILLAPEQGWSKVFIDDIIVYSKSVDEHIEHLKRIICILTDYNFKISLPKSHFGYKTIFLLGHKISQEGIQIDARKLMGCDQWSTPNADNIAHYLGLFNYFRNFVPKYAQVAAPLDSVRKSFSWGPQQEEAWQLMITLLKRAPLLAFPDFNKPFYTASDASKTGVSAVLFQKKDDNLEMGTAEENRENFKIISFVARSLGPAERNYSATKREALGIYYAMVKFRYYILGRSFTHYTDHKALVWMFRQQDDNKTTSTWMDTILEFPGIEVIHLPGITNVLPDHLSRLFQGVKYLEEGTGGGDVTTIRAMMIRNLNELGDVADLTEQERAKIKKFNQSSIYHKLKQMYAFDHIAEKNFTDIMKDEWGQLNYINAGTRTIEVGKIIDRAKQHAMDTDATSIIIVPNYSEATWMQELTSKFQYYHIRKEQYTNEEGTELVVVLIDPIQTKKYSYTDQAHIDINRLVDSEDIISIKEEGRRQDMMEEAHSLGHFGGLALSRSIIMKGYWWDSITKDCAKYVRSCARCQRFTIYKRGYHPYSPVTASLPMDHLSFDLFQLETSTDGYNYVLIVVDICTRFVFLRPLRTKDAISVARKLYKIFCLAGFPRILHSDNGTEFANSVIHQMKTKCAMEHRFITAYHPRGNGTAERNVRTCKEVLFKELQGATQDWVAHLPMTQYAVNVKAAALHASSPLTLFFGRKFNDLGNFSDAVENPVKIQELNSRMEFLTKLVYPEISKKVLNTQRIRSENFNANHTLIEIPDGAMVMTRTDVPSGKAGARYEGPYRVLRRTRGGAYQLLDNDGTTLPRKYAPEQLKIITRAEDESGDSERSYAVQDILDDKRVGSKKFYLVSWKGYGKSANSWVVEDDFNDIEVIRTYWKKKLESRSPRGSTPSRGRRTRAIARGK